MTNLGMCMPDTSSSSCPVGEFMHPDEYCVKNCEDYGLEAYEGFCAEYETTPAAECSPNMPFFHPNGVDCVMSCQDYGMEE